MKQEWRKRIDDEVAILRLARDELQLQIHLGASEAHHLWENAESAWEKLEWRLKRVAHATEESAEDVEAAAKLLVEEISHGYQRLRDSLSS